MRIRATKPEFWRSKTIAALGWDVRFVLKGLEAYVDDNGVGKDDIALVAADVFPRDLSSNPRDTLARLSEAISLLSERGLIVRYEYDGEELVYIDRWKQFQRIDKPAKGRFRRPDGTLEYIEDVSRDSYARPPETLAPGTGEQGNRGTDLFSSEVADAPSDPEPENEPSAESSREDVERVCLHLAEVMVANGCRRPTVSKKWRIEARLMIDKDGREPDKIIRAIDWSWADSFWKGKIESIPKLRIQYDKLRIQAQTSKSNVHVADFGTPDPKRTYAADDVRGRWQS